MPEAAASKQITSRPHAATTNSAYAVALSRAFAGALIFSLPMLMTMEMWWIGLHMPAWKLVVFSLFHLVLLFGLSKVSGFEETQGWLDDVLDALAAYAVAVITAAAILWLFGAFRSGTAGGEMAGMIAIQAVPASFGAMIGAKMLGRDDDPEAEGRWRESYSGQLFLMLAGAFFLSFNMAPTEEMILIAFQMDAWMEILLVLVSIGLLHAIVYTVGFPGQEGSEHGHGSEFARHTLPGYAIAFAAALYILWVFGRADGLPLAEIAGIATVLAFPSAIGAGIARLVV
jgi:putative integral membrane protein (TIGR02587 family)